MQRLISRISTAAPRTLMHPVRSFNRSVKPPTVSNNGAYIMGGLGLAGMSFLAWKSMQLNSNKTLYASRGETFMSPTVQKRVASTLGYFGFGLGFTGAVAFALRNSMWAMNLHWGICLAGQIGFMLGTYMTDYHQNYPLKMAFYTAFLGMVGVTIMPLCVMAGGALVVDAALATGVGMSALAAVAYMAPSEEYLRWGGALSLCCGGMFAIAMLGMFNP